MDRPLELDKPCTCRDDLAWLPRVVVRIGLSAEARAGLEAVDVLNGERREARLGPR
jgi:hypothetical protein